MIRDPGSSKHPVRDGIGIAGWGPMLCVLLLAFPVFAQQTGVGSQAGDAVPPAVAGPPATAGPAAAAGPPNPAYAPGFIDAFGRFIGDSAAKLNSQFNSQFGTARDTLGQFGNQTSDVAKTAAERAAGAAKDTAGAIAGLPSARFVDGRERCAVAANGAADCRAAADVVCRGKGFVTGRILDTRSEQKCPARVWLSGHLPAEGECPLETFVTRAVCQ